MGWRRSAAYPRYRLYENVARLVGASMPTRGAIRLPLGNESTILPLISAEDVSRIAVGLLTGPERAAGTAYPVIGSANSIQEIVGAFARVLNRRSTTRRLPMSNGGTRFSREAGTRIRSSICPRSGSRCGLPASRRRPDGSPSRTPSKKLAAPKRKRSNNSFASSRQNWRHRLLLPAHRPNREADSMDRRQLLAAALAPLAVRVAPDALSSKAYAATSERDGKMSTATQRIIESNGIHINNCRAGRRAAGAAGARFPGILVLLAASDRCACRRWLPCCCARLARLRQE